MTALPEDALDREVLVRMTVREYLRLHHEREEQAFDGIPTSEAAAIMGEGERKARRLAAKWEREQNAGKMPEVRVRRVNPDVPQSDLRYDRDDCYAYRRRHGGGPRQTEGMDEADIIVDRLLKEG